MSTATPSTETEKNNSDAKLGAQPPRRRTGPRTLQHAGWRPLASLRYLSIDGGERNVDPTPAEKVDKPDEPLLNDISDTDSARFQKAGVIVSVMRSI